MAEYERLELYLERRRIHTNDRQTKVYDPRFEIVADCCNRGSWENARSTAYEVMQDSPEAGFVAYEIMKRLALEAGKDYRAKEAADGAARAMRQLRSGR
jgi:hypothetical protein